MILPTYHSKLRQDIEHWAKLNDLELNIIVESHDISVKKLMARNGLGLIPAMPGAVGGQVKSGDLVEIGRVKGVSEELFLVSAQRKIENPIAAKLRETFVV